jgi:hypothetical protein
MLLRHLLILLLSYIFFSCSSSENIGPEADPDLIINCSNTEINVSEGDNIVIPHATNPVIWEGTYNDNRVKISYTKPIVTESETFTFVFEKVGNCLKTERAFKLYDGKQVDVSAITEMNVSEFYIKEWEVDKKFAGILIYTDPHDKQEYSHKFWLDFTEENKETESTNYALFDDCLGSKLPIDIDINTDGIVDFKMISEKVRDVGNTPQFNRYVIKLVSTYENENQILSPKRNESPYTVIFEPPFTSENTRQYFNEVKNALDIFYEFDAPYQSFNYFLNNRLTYKGFLENEKEDYYLIKMRLDDNEYYGWIHIKFNSSSCTVAILDTYLSPNPDEHVSVN